LLAKRICRSFPADTINTMNNGVFGMRTHAGRNGVVMVWCDYCANTMEFVGRWQAEEKVKAQGWTVRGGKARCRACTEDEQAMLTRSVWRSSSPSARTR
jgi:hypothetical protein